MNILRLVPALVAIALLSPSLPAQVIQSATDFCGTTGDSPWLRKYKSGEIRPVPKSNAIEYVPYRAVLVGDQDGVGQLEPLVLLASLEELNRNFASINLQYYLQEITYLNNEELYNQTDRDRAEDIAVGNAKYGMLNVYFVNSFENNICGYATSIGSATVVVGNDCTGVGDPTWTHEVGHAYGLFHTFLGWERTEEISKIDLNAPAPSELVYEVGNRVIRYQVEKVDGSNCETAGDMFCDTPPDYLMQNWRCNENEEYKDSLMDPNGDRFAVSGHNFMSYAESSCTNSFSPDQGDAMRANLLTRRDVTSTTVVPAVAAPRGEDLALRFPENGSTTEFYDQIELEWNSVENADFYLVQLNVNRNFGGAVLNSYLVPDTTFLIGDELDPNRTYYWRVRPVNGYLTESDFGDQVWRFKTGAFLTSSIDPVLDAGITVAPNPVSGGQELRISGRDLGQQGTLTYELLDPTGRILQSRANVPVTAGTFREQLPTGHLSAGLYFLRLRLNDKLVTRRVVVSR